jgi:hypothetical protein
MDQPPAPTENIIAHDRCLTVMAELLVSSDWRLGSWKQRMGQRESGMESPASTSQIYMVVVSSQTHAVETSFSHLFRGSRYCETVNYFPQSELNICAESFMMRHAITGLPCGKHTIPRYLFCDGFIFNHSSTAGHLYRETPNEHVIDQEHT